MSSKIEKSQLKLLKANHRARYNAPLGKRRCSKKLTKDCLGLADESQFKCRICISCVNVKMLGDYYARQKKSGIPHKKRGRKPQKVEEYSSGSESESD